MIAVALTKIQDSQLSINEWPYCEH